ncbi:serine protease [Myxococcus landrumensis]|uniref:serine protease n=1 Tax=Myxococcus landrumensis TaxID=2813577 RepID=UPI001F5067A7|nr:serine protease [Myxococcus landrumus]
MSGVVVAVGLLGCGGAEQERTQADAVGGAEQEIVGGVEARPGSHPWIVSLQQGGKHFCGGSLIKVGRRDESDIVVTAAHCVFDGWSGTTVSAGAHDLNNPSVGQVPVRVARAVPHPRYNPDTTLNDIAVLKLERPIKFTSSQCGVSGAMRPNLMKGQAAAAGLPIIPVCLPAAGEQVSDNVEGTVAGWGLTREGGYDTSPRLMQVGVPTINSRDLANMYRPHGIQIDSAAMLGAGYRQGGKDACQGDSGGPYVIKSGSGYVLQGVTSFGVGCARAGLPGVYARVSNYIGWINQQVGIHSNVAGL